jgi:ABC-2 type transport system permease protein
MIFSTIWKYEVKMFLRNGSMVAAWVLFLLAGLFCLQQGNSVYRYHAVAQDSATVNLDRNLLRIQTMMDTTKIVDGKRGNFEYPYYLDWMEGNIAVKHLSPLSALSIGQNDVYPQAKSGRFGAEIFSNDFTEFKNPDRLLAGNLDTSFFVLFLFPLLLISLTYNVRSADRESGIEPILEAQAKSASQVYHLRLLVRWLFALLPVLLLAIISFFVLQNQSGFTTGSFIAWWGVVLLYSLFWLSLIALVQRFRWNSIINGITLCGAWVLLLIAVPGLMNTWFSYQYPNTYKLEASEFRDESYKFWGKPMEIHNAVFLQRYPQLRDSLSKIDSNRNIKSYSYVAQSIEAEESLYNKTIAPAVAQNKAEENSFWLNPFGGVMRVMVALSNGTLAQQHYFEQSVIQYRKQKLHYLFDNLQLQKHFTKQDLANMPTYVPLVQNISNVWVYLLPLIILTILFSVVALIPIKKESSFKGNYSRRSVLLYKVKSPV